MSIDPVIRPLHADQAGELMRIDTWAFPTQHDDDATVVAPAVEMVEWDRTFGAYLPEPESDPASGTADHLGGVYLTYSMQLPIPGGVVPAAGLSWVGVHPQFRRRGIARAMVTHHLHAAADHREPVSILHAAEAGIYGRFGYGMASRHLSTKIPRGSALRDVPGSSDLHVRFDHADPDRYADLVGDCFDRVGRARPGWAARTSPGARRRPFFDPPVLREGAEKLRLMYVPADENGSAIRGYVLFRRRQHWTGRTPDGTVTIRELVAPDVATARALWGRVLDLDLMTTVEAGELPLDDPLFELLVDYRAAEATISDGLWLRLVDLPAALVARQYSRPVDVTFTVTDDLLPGNSGTWRLVAPDDGPATCEPSDQQPAFVIDTRVLASAYLGTSRLVALAAAGLVDVADPAAFAVADTAFSWPVAPYCGWVF